MCCLRIIAVFLFGWVQVIISPSVLSPLLDTLQDLLVTPVSSFIGDSSNAQEPTPGIFDTTVQNPERIPNSIITEHIFRQKISHFPNDPKYFPHLDGTFAQRYWIDTTFYQPGGPVFLLDAGEIAGQLRIPFLQRGILRLLTETFHGVGLILEMRYYGTSFPTVDLSTDSLRFLDTKQSLADAAYFSQNVIFPGLESHSLTAPGTPWIYYGGSYAGAKAAYMRIAYPDLIWGAIGSSATVHAVVAYSDYFVTIERNADQECIKGLRSAITTVDTIISSRDLKAISKMKADFGVPNLTHLDDFVSLITWLVTTYQEQNWDSSSNSRSQIWDQSCQAIRRVTPGPNFDQEVYHTFARLTTEYISRKKVCPTPEDPDKCFGTYDLSSSQAFDLTQTWRSWMYQCCREEGFYPTHVLGGGASIVSRYLTLDYNTRQCKQSFPPGKYNRIPSTPDVSVPNSYGGYDIAADRLAFIDGRKDPWLYATPHSPLARPRPNTLNRPFYLIEEGVHHYDENGLPGGLSNQSLPREIRDVQSYEIKFVASWLDEFRRVHKLTNGLGSELNPSDGILSNLKV